MGPSQPQLFLSIEMNLYPSKALCLQMAIAASSHNEKLMWEWLIAWGFYEMYIEGELYED